MITIVLGDTMRHRVHTVTPAHFLQLARNYPLKLQPTERDARSIARAAVSVKQSATTVIGRRLENDWMMSSQKERLDAVRLSAMSVALRRQHVANAQAAREQEARAKASAADRRRFQPDSFATPRTVFGTEAWTKVGTAVLARAARKFASPVMVVPCVARSVRREVLFALKRNKGHRSKKRRNSSSYIGC